MSWPLKCLIAVVGLTLLASTVAVPAASAQSPPARLRGDTSAWKQLRTMVRKRGRKTAAGFDFHPTLHLRAADGYRVKVITAGPAIAVVVGRQKGAVTAYLARGIATSRRLKASFGRFGRLDMRFHPSAHLPPLRSNPRCHGAVRHLKHRGTWAGSFHFTGENDYVLVRIHRAPGSILRPKPVCAHSFTVRKRQSTAMASGPFSPFSRIEAVEAGWHHGLESVDFAGVSTSAGAFFICQSTQALGSVSIIRIARVVSKPGSGDLAIDGALTHAEVRPPAPFHGTGTYAAARDGTKTWLGDLAVNFPGAPGVPLTGDQFKVEVKRPL